MRTRRDVSLIIKASALILVVAVGLDRTGLAQQPIELSEDSQSQILDQKAAKAKAEVTKRGLGQKSRVRVKMRDKHQFTGRIIQIDEQSFQLQVEPSFLDDLEPAKGTVLRIPYSEVEKIRRPRSRAANLGIGVGAIVAAVLMLAAIVVLRADLCRSSYCH